MALKNPRELYSSLLMGWVAWEKLSLALELTRRALREGLF